MKEQPEYDEKYDDEQLIINCAYNEVNLQQKDTE